jgi:hypothetical protein
MRRNLPVRALRQVPQGDAPRALVIWRVMVKVTDTWDVVVMPHD